MSDPTEQARHITLLALDVDGVLTDGAVIYGNSGEELKAFNIKDGLGIKLLQSQGIEVAIITGRRSDLVARRARELGISHIIQGREDKLEALRELSATLQVPLANIAYMGDDLPDLGAIGAAGLGMTVADGCAQCRAGSDWCSQYPGGGGAVREACEYLLQQQGKLAQALAPFLGQH